MSNDWRASLVPAAAVIPAPRAYTNIAAVKALVVCHWAAGLLGGLAFAWSTPVQRVSAGVKPPAECPAPAFNDGEKSSCSKSPSVEVEAVLRQKHALWG